MVVYEQDTKDCYQSIKVDDGNVSYDTWLDIMSAFMMKDGAIVLFYYDEQHSNVLPYANIPFVIDVNGKKGPNRWGYDVFWLTLVKTSDNGLRLTDEYSSLSEKGGSLPRNILLNNWSNDYNKNTYWGLWK